MPEQTDFYEKSPINDLESLTIDGKMSIARMLCSLPVLALSGITRFEGDTSNSKALLIGGITVLGTGVVKYIYDSIQWGDGFYVPKDY
jgi:hypothetical protein